MADQQARRHGGDVKRNAATNSRSRRRSQGSYGSHSAGNSRHAPNAQGRPAQRRNQGSTGTRNQPAKSSGRRVPANGAHANPRRRQRPAPSRKQPRKFSRGLIPALIVAVIVLGVGGFFLVRQLTTKHLTVNGQEATVARSATPRTLVEEGLANPKPGNLMAVDGSLFSKGDGNLCSATVDGNLIGVDDEIPANATVQIDDGTDATEDYDEKEEPIPFNKKEGDTSFSAYWNGSIHLLSDGQEGVQVTKTGKQSGKTVTETKQPAIDAGYIIYSAKPEEKVIALTFDDGPWDQTTGQILDLLEQYNAKATFFTIGQQISGHEDLIKREAALGCQVCTHSWDHAEGSGGGVDISKMSATEQVNEIQKGYAAIANALGSEPSHVLRAPGGNFYGDAITNLWDYVDAEIGWDVDTEDWNKPGSDQIVSRILSATSGNVVLMHDGGGDRSQTVAALQQALPQLVQQGYKFVTIDELLAYGMPTNKIASTTDNMSVSSTAANNTDGTGTSSTSTESNASTGYGTTTDGTTTDGTTTTV